jgi:hypothetical protein
MRHKDRQIGRPSVLYAGAKADIQSLDTSPAGQIAYASDTNEIALSDGSQWSFGFGSGGGGNRVGLITPSVPKLADFTWRNQGTNGTVVEFDNGIFLQCVSVGSSDDIKALTQAAPNGSFIVTMGFYASVAAVPNHKSGIMVYNPSNDRSIFFMTPDGKNDRLKIQRTRLTAYDSTLWDGPEFNFSQPIFMRIEYDSGAGRYYFSYSVEGVNFIKVAEDDTNYIGSPPDVDIGFGTMTGPSSIPSGITVVHWEVKQL